MNVLITVCVRAGIRRMIDVVACLKQLRSSDSAEFDVAFEALRLNIQAIKNRVFHAMKSESDPHAKGALIELLGESQDPRFISPIAEQFSSDSGECKFWAYVALQKIGTAESLKEAHRRDLRQILSEASKHWNTRTHSSTVSRIKTDHQQGSLDPTSSGTTRGRQDG